MQAVKRERINYILIEYKVTYSRNQNKIVKWFVKQWIVI